MADVAQQGFVVIGQNPKTEDFFYQERKNNNGKPGEITLMGDGKGDVTGVINSYIKKGYSPDKIIYNGQPLKDELNFSAEKNNKAPKISGMRLMFSRLTDEQIKEINKTGKLPDNAKFVKIDSNYVLTNNWFNITPGTQKLPAGYELKKTVLGFTTVVPEETKGLFIKDAV